MFYYRYRSGSELAMKELIYDELYFASKDECNDPYEGKIFAKLDADKDLWNKIIHGALTNYSSNILDYLTSKIVSFFVQKSPIYVDAVLEILDSGLGGLAENEVEKLILENMSEPISQYILQRLPTEQYFASFSRRSDNYLLWSHYANNHTGFCLVFRATNGILQQSSAWQKEYIPFAVNNIDMPFAFSVPQSFKFRDVEYVDTPSYLDGGSLFSTCETIYTDDAEELNQLYEKYIQTYLQKHRVWDYEEETRIILAAGSPLATGRKVSIPPHHRLFHYESTQLAGIVLGANMPSNQRRRVRDIVSEKVHRWNTYTSNDKSSPSFVIFEESFSESNREVKPVPVEIYKGTSIFDAEHSQFQALLNEWNMV